MQNGNIYQGIVVSKGKFRGKIKKVFRIEDVLSINEGDIVVTKNNSPLFSLAFMKASAIISECGGGLCHLAIVAREMEKPCILSVENAMKIFENNMLVEIDGNENKIRIIEDGS